MTNANDEELEANDEEHESETDGEASTEESEVEDSVSSESDETESDTSGDTSGNTSEARKARKDAQIERLKEENRKLKEEAKGQSKVVNSELIDRTYLAANDIKDKDAQNEIIRLARKFDFTIDQALDDPDIKQRADSIIKKKVAERAVAKGTGGATSQNKNETYYLNYYQKNGDFPEDAPSSMIAKVTELLAKQ